MILMISKTRRNRLNQAIEDYAKDNGISLERGALKSWCDEFLLNANVISQYRNGTRNITDVAAHKIEQSANLPSGWLSREKTDFVSREALNLARLYDRFPPEAKSELINYAEFIRARIEDDPQNRDALTRLTESLKKPTLKKPTE